MPAKNRLLKSNRSEILIALLINVLIVLVCFLIFTPTFETNDDTGLIAIASGIRGARDAHIVHTNYLVGKLMTALYAAAPGVQWWSILQFVLLFISFFLITRIFIHSRPDIAGILFTAAVVSYFSYEGYVRIQYTKSAGIICAAGLIVLFAGLLGKKPALRYIIIGILLTVAGSFYRIQEFVCVTAVFTSMILYGILYCRDEVRRPGRRILAALIAGLLLLVIVGGLRVYDRNQYKDPEWSAYLEFDKYRTEVLDYGVPDYDKHEEEYNAVGIDKSAYKLMKSWTFQDNEKFTAETFKTIAGFRAKKTINASFVKSFIKSFAKDITRKEGTFLCFLVAALCWLITGRHKLRNFVSLILMCAVIAALNFYLYYAGRFMVNRVDVGIWLAASLIIMYQCFMDRRESEEGEDAEEPSGARSIISKIAIIALTCAVAASFVYFEPWQQGLKAVAESKTEDAMVERETIEEIGNDKEHLYLTKVGTLKFSEAYGVMDPVPYRIADNIYPLGGWGSATPAFTSVLKEHGVQNPFGDMIGNDSIYLIDNKIDITLDYLRTWYKSDAEAELVKTISGHKIYRIK